MQARRKLTEFENTIAFVVGGGMLLILLAFIIAAARGAQADTGSLSNMLIIGAGLFIVGVLAWAFTSRPWVSRDDWTKPQFTGHEEHGAEAHAAPEVSMEHMGVVEPDAPIVEPQKTVAKVEPARSVEKPVATPKIEPEKPVAKVAAAKPVEKPAAPPKVEAAKPVEKPVEKPAAPDDLTLIEGIGPKTAAALQKSGIDTFAKLAALQAAAIEGIVRGAGVRMVGHADSWPKQAQLAAEGKLDALKKYQAELRAGHGAATD